MFTIGEVAKAAGVNVETVRYYQRRGLLQEPAKPTGGHRRYPEHEVTRLRFIKRAQGLGFTLQEIDNLLRLRAGNCCSETHDMAVLKLSIINAKITELLNIKRALKDLVHQCEQLGNQEGNCPIMQSLAPER